MNYEEIINQINNNSAFREQLKKAVKFEDDDFNITTTNSTDSYTESTEECIIKLEFIGGYQDFLITLSLNPMEIINGFIRKIYIESIDDLAEEKVTTDKLNFDIDYWSYNITYDQLSRMKNDNKIEVPNMQRGFVWDRVQASKLIESILMGLPLPSLFLIKQDNGKYLVVDGLQRITTIHAFKYNQPLPNSKKSTAGFSLIGVNDNLINNTYASIEKENPSILDRFDMGTINVIEFKQNKPEYEEAMYSLFERLNSGGTNLSPQQIRNSIYYGTFNEQLNDFSKKLNVYFSQQAINSMAPSELALRAIAIVKCIKDGDLMKKDINSLNGSIIYKKALNDTSEEYHMRFKKIERLEENRDEQEQEFGNEINNTFDNLKNSVSTIERIFGKENAFRRFESGNYKKRISPILFESIIATVLLYSDCKMIEDEKIILGYQSVFNNKKHSESEKDINNESDYEKYFTQGTGKLKNIVSRINTMRKVLFNE